MCFQNPGRCRNDLKALCLTTNTTRPTLSTSRPITFCILSSEVIDRFSGINYRGSQGFGILLGFNCFLSHGWLPGFLWTLLSSYPRGGQDAKFNQNVNVHGLLGDLGQERVCSSSVGAPRTPSGLSGPRLLCPHQCQKLCV